MMETSDLSFRDSRVQRTFSSYASVVVRCRIDPRFWGKDRPTNYGELEVFEEWLWSFKAFVRDLGLRPEGTTLDRIDNNGGYVPGNCRWATAKEQSRNRSNSIFVEYKGERRKLIELCEELGVDHDIVRGRLKVGVPLERALTQPKRYSWRRVFVDGKEISLSKHCQSLGLDYQLVRDRLRNGWDLERAMHTPKMSHKGSPSQKYQPKIGHYE